MSKQPPQGAPEGTVWFGGPVPRLKATLRVLGPDVDADEVSRALGCEPTPFDARFPQRSAPGGARWRLRMDDPDGDLDALVRRLFARLTSDLDVWKDLTTRHRVDLFCGVFLGTQNQGLGIAYETAAMLAARRVSIGFDIYAAADGTIGSPPPGRGL